MPDRARKQSSQTFVLDRAAARALDRAATEEFGIPGIVLMENAAIALAREALGFAGAKPIAIVCGRGNNGGDGWALGRHLENAGRKAVFIELGAPKQGTDADVNRAIAMKMGVEQDGLERLADEDFALVVDAIFGTGLDRPVTGDAAAAIDRINTNSAPVLAVDVPSGLDADTGEGLGCTVRATRTVTFVGLKPGFLTPSAEPYLGEVVVAGIGAPCALIERLGRPLPAASVTPSFLRPPA